MPRFNQKRWSPVKDSSEGFRTIDPRSIVLHLPGPIELDEIDDPVMAAELGDIVGRPACPCGCGDYPEGKKSTFRMGHDARLKGILIRAHLTETVIKYVDDVGDEISIHSGMGLAVKHGWEKYLHEAEERRDQKNKDVLARAIGSKRLISVGRWEYTGQVAAVYSTDEGGVLEVEYVTKSGEVKRKRVPESETIEVS